MKTRIFLRLTLLAVFLAACTPATSTVSPTQPMAVAPSATIPPSTDTFGQDNAVSTDVIDPTPLPIATSRGPDLEATDPATVSLASGGIQLVEFFRFT